MLIDDPSLRLSRRRYRKARTILRLRARNLTAAALLGTAPVAVSLTSYGARLAHVALTIESIAAGDVRPRRLILWVSDDDFSPADHPMLARQVSRGLEILRTADLGPHKKSFPYCLAYADHGLPLVSADDDILYPSGWLSTLVESHVRFPHDFVGLRAHGVRTTSHGQVAPYAQWEPIQGSSTGPRTFLTSGAGAVFPQSMMRALRDSGDEFLQTCPKADDVWNYVTALRNGITLRKVSSSLSAYSLPGSQREALHHDNVTAGGNDDQLARTLRAEDLVRILSEGGA